MTATTEQATEAEQGPTARNKVLGVILIVSGLLIAAAGIITYVKTDVIEALIACLVVLALTIFILIRERTIGRLERELAATVAE